MDKTMKRDIPLEFAVLEWRPVYDEWSEEEWNDKNAIEPGFVRVYWHGEDRPSEDTSTAGACDAEWQEHPSKRLTMLYIEMWHAVACDGIDTADMHLALSVIPEYRATLSADFEAVSSEYR